MTITLPAKLVKLLNAKFDQLGIPRSEIKGVLVSDLLNSNGLEEGDMLYAEVYVHPSRADAERVARRILFGFKYSSLELRFMENGEEACVTFVNGTLPASIIGKDINSETGISNFRHKAAPTFSVLFAA